ncbi:MAG: FAD-dependent oxidoreductase [Arenicellales bacterium]
MFDYWQRMDSRIENRRGDTEDSSVADIVDRDSRWTPFYDYWTSLMTSSDSDLVSAVDMAAYRDTHENWPVTGGYGNLVARFGADIPVALNSAVERIQQTRSGVRVHTVRGTAESRTVLLTVSSGVLASDHIRFEPALPDWKREAVAAVRSGNHNRIAIALDDDPFGDDAPVNIIDMDDETPMLMRVKPYGHPYVVGGTGGRFADWLERAGVEASVDHPVARLKRIFGGGIEMAIGRRLVTAWGGDPWTLGAYSSCLPGQAHQREILAAPVDDRLWFAGEATSPEFFSTCHGAYLTGIHAVRDIAGRLEH